MTEKINLSINKSHELNKIKENLEPVETELKDIEQTNSSFNVSPTCYHSGMHAELINNKQYCTINQIQALFEKNKLLENDIIILQTLFKYRYLTRYCLSNLISQLPVDVKKRSNYKNSLSKLAKMGLILKYQMQWEENGLAHGSPCFYGLSRSGGDYVRRITGNKNMISKVLLKPISSSALEIITTATLNQFHCRMISEYADRIIKSYLWFEIQTGSNHVTLPGIYRFRTHILGSGHLDFIVLIVRTNPDHEKQVIDTLITCESYKKNELSKFDNPFYILVCENGEHAKELNQAIKNSNSQNIPYLFSLDRTILQDAPLDHLFLVSESPYGYELILQKIKIND